MFQDILNSLAPHRGKILGLALGLLAGLIIIQYGFWRGLFLWLCAGTGYYIGHRYDTYGWISRYLNQFLR